MDFTDKVVLVTGGTSGIGQEVALKFAKAGAKVVLAGRREEEGQAVVDEIASAGGEAKFIQTDITQEDQVKQLVDSTVSSFGRLDIAVNNAGVEVNGPVTDFTEADYRKVFDINVLGVLLSLKYEIPAMLKSGGGSIVNTSSVAGNTGMAEMSLYVASKFAVEGITKSVALELAEKSIRVNAVAPAAIVTPMLNRITGGEGTEMYQQFVEMHPVKRLGKSKEVAAAILFLASDAASFSTGITLPVDGGMLA
ncbi:Short chain dehydrogenase [Planctomycetales bacterium 10988]|nr:Short chain dehydrogenase [Planctomycetales bacterium 10988]